MYQALYRKYRPRNFDEVVGQDQITVTLKNEIASGRIGHAYLFTGSRGTGKTSCSKIIAKAVNCPNQLDGNPCGVCNICRGIDDASIMDVSEIDAASNNSVDDIRQLRDEANFTPVACKYRVYIIDEAHMLSINAVNALLKIMEEPPEHVIFILATTEIHKIPATILSRCQRFDFKRIKVEIIQAQIVEICQKENISIEHDAAKLIARLSEGGMRDALSLLDVCRSTALEITAKVVTEAAGLAMQHCLFEIGDAVLRKDVPAMIDMINQMHENSIDFEKMCVQLIAHYRGLMMAKSVKNPEKFILNLDEDIEHLKQQSVKYTMPNILYCLTTLQDTLSRMSRTSQTRTELEMAMIKLTNPAMESSAEALNARISKLEEATRSPKFVANLSEISQTKKAEEKANEQNKQENQPKQISADNLNKSKAMPISQDEAPKTELVQPFAQWAEVLNELKHTNGLIHGALLHTDAYQCDGLILIDCEDPFFLDMVRNNEYTKKSIHDALIKASGRDFRIGPYKKEKYKPQEIQSDPMEIILKNAEKQGVDIDFKDS